MEITKNCPVCAGKVTFCKDPECDGCHWLACSECNAYFDLSVTVDPDNKQQDLDGLRELIADRWNG